MKTFILDAVASYTQGTMVIAVESIEKFKELFRDYHERRLAFLREFTKDYKMMEENLQFKKRGGNKFVRTTESFKLEEEGNIKFREENNKPFDFEIDTGVDYLDTTDDDPFSHYIKYGDIRIFTEHPEKVKSYWFVVKEFDSNLPEGTHYYGEYCA